MAGEPTTSPLCTAANPLPLLVAALVRQTGESHAVLFDSANSAVYPAACYSGPAGAALLIDSGIAHNEIKLAAPIVWRFTTDRQPAATITEQWAALVESTALSALMLQRLQTELTEARAAALHDPLTGLWNRRGYAEQLAGEAARARRHGYPCGLILLDLRNFKGVNDRAGYVGGDQLLCAVADTLRKTLRTEDHACRWGGDEFALILPHCPATALPTIANRIAQALVEIGVAARFAWSPIVDDPQAAEAAAFAMLKRAGER